MTRQGKRPDTRIETFTHGDAKRWNIPTAELQSLMREIPVAIQARRGATPDDHSPNFRIFRRFFGHLYEFPPARGCATMRHFRALRALRALRPTPWRSSRFCPCPFDRPLRPIPVTHFCVT